MPLIRGLVRKLRMYEGGDKLLWVQLSQQTPQPKDGYFRLPLATDGSNHALLMFAAANGFEVEFSTDDYKAGEIATVGRIEVFVKHHT